VQDSVGVRNNFSFPVSVIVANRGNDKPGLEFVLEGILAEGGTEVRCQVHIQTSSMRPCMNSQANCSSGVAAADITVLLLH
jgi:hypothetical protein